MAKSPALPGHQTVNIFFSMRQDAPTSICIESTSTPEKSPALPKSTGLFEHSLVDRHDASVAAPRTFLRFAVLGAPFFLAHLVDGPDWSPSPGAYLLSAIVFGLGGAILYLNIFNGSTRQSLHDLVAGTYVVRASAEAELDAPPIGQGHLVVAALWVVAATLLAPVLPGWMGKGKEPGDLAAARHRLDRP